MGWRWTVQMMGKGPVRIGWLSFCIRKGREVLETSQELGRFPRRKSLRPFVHLHGYPGTAVSLVRGA